MGLPQPEWPLYAAASRQLGEAAALLAADPARSEALCAPGADWHWPPDLRVEAGLVAADAALKQMAPERTRAYLADLTGLVTSASPLWARFKRIQGHAALLLGQPGEAIADLATAAEAARLRGDHTTQGEALNMTAQIQHSRGESHAALTTLTEAQLLFAEVGNAAAEIKALCNQALIELNLGRTADALRALYRAHDLLPHSGTPLGSELNVQSTLGMLSEQMDRREEALAQFNRAREVAEQMNNAGAAATMALNAGEMARRLNRTDEARALLEQALETASLLRMERIMSAALCSLGVICAESGQFDEAETRLSEGQRLATELKDVEAQLDAMLGRGRNWLRRGSPRQAVPILSRALETARASERPKIMLDAHLLLAEAHEHHQPRRTVRHLKAARVLEAELRNRALDEQARELTSEARLSSVRLEAQHERQLREVSEQARAQAESTVREQLTALEHGRLYDPLTGLPNRLLLGVLLTQALAAHHDLTVVVVDLSRFGQINEAFGHDAGDEVLREVTRRLLLILENGDTLARLSSDEFAVILQGQSAAGDLRRGIRWLQTAFEQEFNVGGQQVVVRASFGAAAAPMHGTDPDTLLRAAHAALTQAKGGLGSAVYNGPDNDQVASLSLDSALSRALERGEFSLHFQPLVDSSTGKVVCAETLLRWEHPILGRRSPAEFIPLLERSGQIEAVGEWVLREACRGAVQWGHTRVAVNLSARQFMRGDLAASVARVLYDTGLPGEHLELEITESLMMQSPERAVSMLSNLRATGVRVMLDDFGTGFSNLHYLKDFPLDGLKIDRSFVNALGDDDRGGAIIDAIVRMSRSLGLDVVAEGVETEAQWAALHALGVPVLQGYLFGKPTAGWTPRRYKPPLRTLK